MLPPVVAVLQTKGGAGSSEGPARLFPVEDRFRPVGIAASIAAREELPRRQASDAVPDSSNSLLRGGRPFPELRPHPQKLGPAAQSPVANGSDQFLQAIGPQAGV